MFRKTNIFKQQIEFVLPTSLVTIFRAESDSGHDSPSHRKKCQKCQNWEWAHRAQWASAHWALAQ